MNLRVAYCLDQFPTVSETFILNEMIALRQQRVEVVIYSRFKPEVSILHEQAQDFVKSVTYLDNLSRTAKLLAGFEILLRSPIRFVRTLCRLRHRSTHDLWLLLGYCFFLSREINRSGVQHIHSHFAAEAAELAMYVSFFTGVPYSFTTHGYDIFFFPPSNYRYRSRFAKFVVAVSEYNRKYLIRHFRIPSEKVRMIHCGVDTTFFHRTKPLYGNTVLCVTRLEPVKGLQYLIEACDILKKNGIAFECKIVGDGSERPILKEMISRYGLNQDVHLVGAKSQMEVLAYLKEARLFALPSLSEGLPVSLMEALSCRVPVVATRVRGMPELVEDGVNGFLVPPKDACLLAERMAALLRDQDLCRKLGNAGRRKVTAEFDLTKQASKLKNAFLE